MRGVKKKTEPWLPAIVVAVVAVTVKTRRAGFDGDVVMVGECERDRAPLRGGRGREQSGTRNRFARTESSRAGP